MWQPPWGCAPLHPRLRAYGCAAAGRLYGPVGGGWVVMRWWLCRGLDGDLGIGGRGLDGDALVDMSRLGW